MDTVCHNQLTFKSLFHKEVIADFKGGRITSDAGGLLLRELDRRYRLLLLRELDRRYRLTEKATACLRDPRQASKVRHDLLSLVRQRLLAIALGYEDNNDAATLARDPALKIMVGRAPESASDLASQ
ncbi:MAG: transposase, partial [Deltaproteobacteria bacterium]|nr:transposase [Deltaproteobacteria bacterium]